MCNSFHSFLIVPSVFNLKDGTGFVPSVFLFIPSITFVRRVRTSSGTFLTRGRDKFIRNIEKKIADFTFIPAGMHFLVSSASLYCSCSKRKFRFHLWVNLEYFFRCHFVLSTSLISLWFVVQWRQHPVIWFFSLFVS